MSLNDDYKNKYRNWKNKLIFIVRADNCVANLPELTEEQIKYVVEMIREFYKLN